MTIRREVWELLANYSDADRETFDLIDAAESNGAQWVAESDDVVALVELDGTRRLTVRLDDVTIEQVEQ